MERLDDLEAFLAIIEKGSQTAASRHLRRPLQSLNRSLMALERALGVELVKRTTRRSEPTEAGRVFYERIECSPCLARTCRFGHYDCLRRIAPEAVAAALGELGALD